MTVAVYGQYDLVIVGGTPGGIMAGIAAAKQGKTSVILERTNHIGGLPANGAPTIYPYESIEAALAGGERRALPAAGLKPVTERP